MAADVNIKIVLQDKGAKRQIQSLINQMNRLQSAAKGVTKAFQRTNKTTRESAIKTAILGEKMKQAALRTQKLEQTLNRTARAGKRVGKGFSVANIALSSFIGNITSRIVSAGITSLINGLRSAVQAGIDFEVGLVNISKTTGISGKALESLGRSIQSIGKEIPVATNALLEIATVAGQLGLKSSDNIRQFTETMAKLQLATDITGREGSQSVAKILDITGELKEEGIKNIQKFGSVITKLGNDFAATESQILSVAKEIAKGTVAFNISSEDVLGLATAFKATGSEAAIAGSAIQRTFIEIGKAVNAGGEKLKRFTEAAGLTGDEFKNLFESDPTAAFLALTKGLGETTSSGGELAEKLGTLGLGSIRVTKSLLPLVARYGLLSRAISTARQEATDLTALNDEALRAQDTLAADLQKLSNSFDRFSVVLFDKVGPALRSITQGLSDFLDTLTGIGAVETFSQSVQKLLRGIQRVPLDVLLMNTSMGKLAISVGITSDSILELSDNLISLEGISRGLAGGLTAAAESTKSINERTTTQNKLTIELTKGYEDLGEEGQQWLDILNSTTQGFERAEVPLTTYTKLIKGMNSPLFAAAEAQKQLADSTGKTTKAIVLFEQDKTKELKKFFKEEEIARLTSAFNIKKVGEEQLAFTRFVTQEGIRRRTEAFKASIGLDKATIDAERNRQAELTRLAGEEKGRITDLFTAKQNARTAERELELLTSGEQKLLKEEELQGIVDFLSREQQARAQAKLDSITNEIEHQTAITEIRTTAFEERKKRLITAEKEIEKILAEAATRQKRLEKVKNQAILSSSAGLFGALASVARTGGKETLGIYKALATAQAIISTFAAVNKTLAEPALPYPANVIQAAAIGIQGAANVISIQQQGFADGGIVGGNSRTGDRLTVGVNSGEMILKASQQKRLFDIAEGRANASGQQELVSHITVMIDGEEVGNTVSRQVANGLILGEVQ